MSHYDDKKLNGFHGYEGVPLGDIPRQYSNVNGYGDMLADLAEMEKAANKRHREPASPVEFLKWVTQTLRDHRSIYEELGKEHQVLVKKADSATIGLKRLGSLAAAKDQQQLQHLRDIHRNLIHANQGILYTLKRCKNVLDETTMNYQLAGETLTSSLADKHKKVGVQQELGLRLKDIDADFKKCRNVVDSQKKHINQLSTAIQKLMNKASIKLPPKVRENINKEDAVNKLALKYQKELPTRNGVNPGSMGKYITKKSRLNGLGEEAASTPATASTSKMDSKAIIASVAAGLTIGAVLIYGLGGLPS